MQGEIRQRLQAELDGIREAGLWKGERVVEGPQGAHVPVDGREVLNFCANNYLGLADDPTLVRAAQDGLARWGLGLASVRFICGTQTIHKDLEAAIADFLGMDDAVLYTSCFDANGGLFETLLDEPDVVISDALNHASIIDGVRLCRAQRQRYAHGDMDELERLLKAASSARTRLIATDGVFSMDGDVAPLGPICDLAERYDALVMVDDSHATGFFGPTGRGTPEHCGVAGRVDIVTSTLRQGPGRGQRWLHRGPGRVVALLRQRSRPYLFSNTPATRPYPARPSPASPSLAVDRAA
jgi:glycine C-acetyltransferase